MLYHGNCRLIALFAPVNESIWEHTKLGILPTLFWWCFYLLFDTNLEITVWLTGCFVSIITSILVSPILFYFYTQGFGFESIWMDISIFGIAVILRTNTRKAFLFISLLYSFFCFNYFIYFSIFTLFYFHFPSSKVSYFPR